MAIVKVKKADLNGKWLGRHLTEEEALNAVSTERSRCKQA